MTEKPQYPVLKVMRRLGKYEKEQKRDEGFDDQRQPE